MIRVWLIVPIMARTKKRFAAPTPKALKSLRVEYNQTCHNSIRGTDAIVEYNQTPDRRVIDSSNTGKDLKAFCGTADAIAPRRDFLRLPARS